MTAFRWSTSDIGLGVTSKTGILGHSAYHVPVQNALEYVAGYTIINDVSGRDLQFPMASGYTGRRGLYEESPGFMKPRDVVEIDIEGMETLRNSAADFD